MVRDKGVQELDKEEEGGRSTVPMPALKSSLGVAKYIRQSANKAENVQQPQHGQVDATLHNETRSVLSAKSMFENNNNVSKIEQPQNQMPPAPAVSKSNQDCKLTKSAQQTDKSPTFESRSVLATKCIFENSTSKKEQAKQTMLKQVVPKINGHFQQTKFENRTDVIAEKCAVENTREVPPVSPKLAASSSSVPDSPETMSRFLSLVERMSEDKERRTGSGRLDMTELEAALTNFQSGSAGSNGHAGKGSGNAGAGSPPPPLPLSSPPRSSGQQRQDVGEEAAGQHKRSHDTNAKSSFLNTTLSHTTSATTTTATAANKAADHFSGEKSSLLGELRARLQGEEADPGTSGRRELGGAVTQEQAVSKLVYNHYRGMLNSYRNNK